MIRITVRFESSFTQDGTSDFGVNFIVPLFSRFSSSRFKDSFHSFASGADSAAVRLDGSVHIWELGAGFGVRGACFWDVSPGRKCSNWIGASGELFRVV